MNTEQQEKRLPSSQVMSTLDDEGYLELFNASFEEAGLDNPIQVKGVNAGYGLNLELVEEALREYPDTEVIILQLIGSSTVYDPENKAIATLNKWIEEGNLGTRGLLIVSTTIPRDEIAIHGVKPESLGILEFPLGDISELTDMVETLIAAGGESPKQAGLGVPALVTQSLRR